MRLTYLTHINCAIQYCFLWGQCHIDLNNVKLMRNWTILSIDHLPDSPPSAPGNHSSILCFCVSPTLFYFLFFLCLPTLNTSYSWNHIVSVLLWWVHFTYWNVLRVHPCGHIWQNLLYFNNVRKVVRLNHVPPVLVQFSLKTPWKQYLFIYLLMSPLCTSASFPCTLGYHIFCFKSRCSLSEN